MFCTFIITLLTHRACYSPPHMHSSHAKMKIMAEKTFLGFGYFIFGWLHVFLVAGMSNSLCERGKTDVTKDIEEIHDEIGDGVVISLHNIFTSYIFLYFVCIHNDVFRKKIWKAIQSFATIRLGWWCCSFLMVIKCMWLGGFKENEHFINSIKHNPAKLFLIFLYITYWLTIGYRHNLFSWKLLRLHSNFLGFFPTSSWIQFATVVS